jgi:hypothetical protein
MPMYSFLENFKNKGWVETCEEQEVYIHFGGTHSVLKRKPLAYITGTGRNDVSIESHQT